MMRWTTLNLVLACALMLASCIETPDFVQASLVAGPRVLAVVTEPPEIHPGETVALSLLVAGVEDREHMQITWRACGSFDAFFGGGSQYGEEQPDEGCGGGVAFPLGEGETATLPGALTADLFDNLEVIAMTIGSALPEGILEQIRSSVGLAFLIEATMIADGKQVRAVKRILISENPTPHSNPPPPHFALGEREIIADDSATFRCVAADGEPVNVATNVEIELAPNLEADAELEAWLEPYRVIDARGELLERQERAFYSWLSTGGKLSQGLTKSPLRNEIWRTPATAGECSLWLVIRDGHGGTSACELRVTVIE